MLLDEFFALRKADKAERKQLLSKLDRMGDQLLSLNESSQVQEEVIARLKKMIADFQKQNQLLQKENAALKEQKSLSDKNRFGRKSHKISSEKAVNYLNNFGNQIFAYLKGGRYSIDNSIAERFIRPLAGERKNSWLFGSNRMAHVSAALSICRANSIAALSYLKKFFREVVKGRRDYENLLPMTIGISTNKL